MSNPLLTSRPDKPDSLRAPLSRPALLDRLADLALSVGNVPLAERLAFRAADLRSAAA